MGTYSLPFSSGNTCTVLRTVRFNQKKPKKETRIKIFYQNLFISLPNDKIIDWPIFKVFTEDKLITTKKLKFVHESVENVVQKGENAGCQKLSYLEVL